MESLIPPPLLLDDDEDVSCRSVCCIGGAIRRNSKHPVSCISIIHNNIDTSHIPRQSISVGLRLKRQDLIVVVPFTIVKVR